MNAFGWLTHPWALLWTEALLHFVWQGAALAVIAALVLRLHSPQRRYAGLNAVFFAMTVCPFITLAVLWLASDRHVADAEIIAANSTFDFVDLPETLPAQELFIDRSGTFTAVEQEPETRPLNWLRDVVAMIAAWQPSVFLAWLIGVAILLARLLLGIVSLSGLIRSSVPAPPKWTATMQRLIVRSRNRISVTMSLSKSIAEPLAVWWWRPVILLPAAWLAETPPGVLESVLAHEIAHLRRWDLWINFYQRLGEMLLFYHPAVWWVSRRIRIERELCCDAAAVALTGEPLGYAQALEYVVRQRLEQVRPLLAAGMGGTEMTLLNRVQRVLGLESPQRWNGGWSLGLTAAAVMVAGGLMLATASQAVVGDEPADATPKVEEERKDPPREGRDEPRPEGRGNRDGDRQRERDGDRPRGDGPRERDGDRPPREGERRGPPDGPRGEGERGPGRGPGPREGFGERGGPPPGPDIMRELMEQIRALRNEVSELRNEVRALRGGRGPEGDFRGPPRGRGDGPPRDGDVGPRGRGDGPPREGERRGPPDGERGGPPPRGDGAGPEGRRGPREDGPPRPPRDGERGPEGRRGPPPGDRGEGDGERPRRPPTEDAPKKDA